MSPKGGFERLPSRKTENFDSAEAVIRFLTKAVATGDEAVIADAIAKVAFCFDAMFKICADSVAVIGAMSDAQRARNAHEL